MINSWFESYGERYFKGYDMQKLGIDDCYVTVNNTAYDNIYLYGKYEECLGCPFHLVAGPIEKENFSTLIINTMFTKKYKITKALLDPSINLEGNFEHDLASFYVTNFKEFGIYEYKISEDVMIIDRVITPVNIYFPILTVFLIYLVLFSLIPIGQFLWKHLKFQRVDTYPVEVEKESTNKKRLKSLDTFRGMCIVLMVFVNYGHGGYPFLEHAVWNGLAVGDLVFPCFMWIMGVCIPIAINSLLKKGIPKQKSFINILRRSCILFALGLFLNAGPYFDTLRVFGVLQRFGVCYFVVATAVLFIKEETEQTGRLKYFRDIIRIKNQWIFMILLMVVYILIITLVQEPGCERFYLGPGGLHDEGRHANCTGGATGYIDRLILGKHAYQHSLIVKIYESLPHEPEGIIGCLPSIFHVFLGVQAGTILLTYKNHKCRIARWLIWSVATGIIGGALCGFSKDDGLIPINKNLWSLSFVFVTSCLAFVLLTICYVLIDIFHIWSGKPFMFAGMNAIFIYVGHSVVWSNFPFHWFLSREVANSTHFWKLVEHVWATSMWVLVSYYLYKIKFFLSI